jgi:hypothetical protein
MGYLLFACMSALQMLLVLTAGLLLIASMMHMLLTG